MNNLPAIPTGANAEIARDNAAAARLETTRAIVAAQAQIDALKKDMERQRAELEREFQERQAALTAIVAPLQAELAKIQEVGFTVDLYLGRNEEVRLIADGTPAPAGTPLVIRQMVLAADEESLALVESGGVDWSKMESFVDWLVADQAHRDRIIPDERGVVVVVPSRQARDRGDALHDAVERDLNSRAHWIIRNGERLYLMVTDPALRVGKTILPRRDEFVAFFTDPWSKEPMEPGSDRWLKAQEKADARRRHYMRLMLVLQGLIDRSTCWHPLPEGGINLLSLSAQDDGKVIVLNELDMALGDGRETFQAWQKRRNADLRPGMRVVLATNHPDWTGLRITDRGWSGRHRRLSPQTADYPPSGVPLLIEGRREGGLVVRYDRGEVWKRNVPASRRASAVIYPSDRFVLPFDLASVEDLTYYLHHRAARKNYQDMVPIIKATLTAKRAERDAEAGLRQWLAGQLEHEQGVWPDQVDTVLTGLVDWWKTANRWARPLVGVDDPVVAKAAAAILREYRLRQQKAPESADERIVAGAKAAHGDALLVVLETRSGGYAAYRKAGREAWLHRDDIKRDGSVKKTTEWTTIPPRTLATARVVWEAKVWQEWPKHPDMSRMLTGPEVEMLVGLVTDRLLKAGHTPVAVTMLDSRQGVVGTGITAGVDFADLDRKTVKDVTTKVVLKWRRTGSGVESTFGDWWWQYEGVPEFGEQGGRGKHEVAWLDEAKSDVLREFVADRKIRADQDRREADASIPATTAGRDALQAAWLAVQTAKARATFDQDYPGADDLWEHHRGTLKLERGYREPQWAWGLFNRLARAGVGFAGKSVAELAAIDCELHTGEPVEPGDYAALVLQASTQ